MELIYNINRPCCKRESIGNKEDEILCRLSLKNIVAFTSASDLNVKTINEKGDSICHVFVCDLDKPWQIYKVAGFSNKVQCMEWHNNGFQLLITTEGGYCVIYEMMDHLLNCWKVIHTTNIEGESFIAAHWFNLNHGMQMYLLGERKDSPSYSEKIMKDRYTPVLSHYGGKATDGWIGITATGMVCICLTKPGEENLQVIQESLFPTRSPLSLADFLQDKSGDILLIACNYNISQPVVSYRLSLTPAEDSCTVSIKSMGNFILLNEPNTVGADEVKITGLKFLSRIGGLSLIVMTGNSYSSQVERWSLKRQDLTLRRFHQAQVTENKVFAYQWSKLTTITHPSLPLSLALPNLPIRYTSSNHDHSNKFFQYIAIAYKDGSIKIINRHSFQAIATTNLDMGFYDMDKPEKKRRVMPCIVDMMQTFTGCGLLGIDQFGCMYLMKVVNTRDTLTHVHPNYIVSILEYIQMTGLDWWDVLMAIKPGVLETIIQRLIDNFAKQPSVLQENIFVRHMSLRSALYSCSTSGQQRAADCHCRLLLHTISSHFKTQLRPKGLGPQDMGPIEKLSHCSSKNTESDLDKVMVSLNPEHKEFVVEELTIQALAPLIQWAADLVLYLITSLTQGYSGNFPGSTIIRDVSCLETLRELMVVTRMWGIINPKCLPHFTMTTTSLDPMLEMFKILTRIWQFAKDNKGYDFDETLIDNCCLIQSQIYVTNNEQVLFGSVYSSGGSILTQNYPMKFTFNETPDVPPGHMTGDSRLHSEQVFDVVHLVHLGVDPAQPCKKCSRCGSVTLLEPLAKSQPSTPVVKSWEGRWMRSCLCGGMWKKST